MLGSGHLLLQIAVLSNYRPYRKKKIKFNLIIIKSFGQTLIKSYQKKRLRRVDCFRGFGSHSEMFRREEDLIDICEKREGWETISTDMIRSA